MDFPTSGPVGTQVTVTGTGFPECRCHSLIEPVCKKAFESQRAKHGYEFC